MPKLRFQRPRSTNSPNSTMQWTQRKKVADSSSTLPPRTAPRRERADRGPRRMEISRGLRGKSASESPPPTLACRALPRAGNDRVFLRAARALAFGSQNGAGSRRFFPKKVYYGGAPGLESGEIDFYTNSSTYALPFSRTIPVRTPQSASRTEVSRPLCHGRAPLTADRTECHHVKVKKRNATEQTSLLAADFRSRVRGAGVWGIIRNPWC